jgi:hypothetical protein
MKKVGKGGREGGREGEALIKKGETEGRKG